MAYNNSIIGTIGGKALPATIYMFVALLYFVCDSTQFNVNLLRILYVLYYAMSLYYIIVAHKGKFLSRYLKALDIFVLCVACYVIVDIINNGVTPIGSWGNMDFLWWHFRSVVPIYPFYYFGKKNMITGKWFQYMFVFCFWVVYISFTTNIQRLMEQDVYNRSEFTNNMGYYMVALLPMVVFFKRKWVLQLICIGIVAAFTILSFKRGAVLCLSVALLLIIYKEVISTRKTSLFKRIVMIILTTVGVFVLYAFIIHLFNTSDYFVARIDSTLSGDSSGRDALFDYYWNTFKNSNDLNMIFGNGPLATVNELKFSEQAHNDWLEYTIDMGLLGVLLYIVYWKSFIREYFNMKQCCNDEILLAFGLVVVIYFIRTFVSMSFFDMPFYSNIVLGYCVAMSRNKMIIKQ